MAWRLASFLLLLAVGGSLGAYWMRGWGAALGLALAATLWVLMDLWRGLRVLRWLRRPEAGPPPRLWGLWGDVADHARRALRAREKDTAQAQLRLQEFLAAIQASPNGVVLLDAAGHIEWCNQTAALHLGFDAQRDLMQLIGNLLRDPGFAAYYASGDYGHDIVIPGRGGPASRPSRISVQLHPYGEGRKLLLSRDVTALEQAETMRRDFVANVSHEIRTPLTVLTGFVETLQSLPLSAEERSRYLGLMARQAERMQGLVNDLLTLSRLEGSPIPGLGEWVGVGSLAAQCEADARALTESLGKGHTLVFGPAPALEVAGMATELLSAVSNLVGNAIRYTPAGGRIEVTWSGSAEAGLAFSVRDTGPGIEAEHLPRLTERFYRVDRSRSRETGGTGLGLAIVKHVVQRHGGELRMASTPGAGSTFGFQLPPARVRPAVTASRATLARAAP
ncbi:phosphate regulon sensor histidine kinase PhoR [Ramlibacter rhizophilus]|uniref:Phosphate regulon sensor protein PhoR n=1 Tax=Ramlibacter rhizophilus TaxID=1781167 RepID=A0A4Z0BUI9_9BURK|nr:phosphate regulon sensor histidine kinase PhoR [Ramlibacter rhizophilus]TFZ01649.1 phosphate regulon sensor histidine kinase PhoR [Ramlibacter rhizophilus]